MRELLLKMAGGEQSPPRAKAGEIFSAWVGSCLAIACIALLERYATGNSGFPLLIGSFGASAVLAFGAIRSPLAQPRNLVGGHFLSALVGVSCYFLFPGTPWLASCLAVATAIALMHVTKTLHPPGGATSLIAVTGGEGIHRPYREQHPQGAALSAILVVVGRALRKQEKRRGRGREARKRQRRKGGVPVIMKAVPLRGVSYGAPLFPCFFLYGGGVPCVGRIPAPYGGKAAYAGQRPRLALSWRSAIHGRGAA